MAEVIGIVASAAGLASFTAKLCEGVGKFVTEYQSVSPTIQDFYDNIKNLHRALLNIERTLRERPQRYDFEVPHYRDIQRILSSCRNALERLAKELPELADKPSTLNKAAVTLDLALGRNVVAGIMSHISSYTQVLQLSLTSLSLGSIWATRQSHDKLEEEVRKLTHALRTSSLVPRPMSLAPITRRSSFTMANDDEATLVEEDRNLVDEIEAWRASADGVAAAVSLRDLDGKLFDVPPVAIPSHGPFIEVAPKSSSKAIEFDPEEGLVVDHTNHDILSYQFQANQDIVSQLEKKDIYVTASRYQKRGIELKQQLCDAKNIPFELDEEMSMNERLADLLLACKTPDGVAEAEKIFQGLIVSEVKQPEEERNWVRYCRLYHKLGNINMNLGKLETAIRFLERALNRRKQMAPIPYMLVKQTADLLIRVYRLNNDHDKERGLTEWLNQEIVPSIPPVRPSTILEDTDDKMAPVGLTQIGCQDGLDGLAKVWEWSKENGFDIDDPRGFRPDMIDANRGTSPLHQAVEEKNIEVLKLMMPHVASFETTDKASQSTPLLLAASTRHRRVVQLLLENGARVNVRDKSGMTPVHRCQSNSKGVETAKLLLQRDASVINFVDNSGKTALYRAVEMGNEEMVSYLLDQRANPNISHKLPGSASKVVCTPLIMGIHVVATKSSQKIRIVEALLAHGADPRMTDMEGRNAFVAAKDSGLAKSVIEGLLRQYAAPSASGTRAPSTSHSTLAPTLTGSTAISGRRISMASTEASVSSSGGSEPMPTGRFKAMFKRKEKS